jgi:hypothetical protein
MTGPLTSPAEKKMESMPQAEACGSPCLKLTTCARARLASCSHISTTQLSFHFLRTRDAGSAPTNLPDWRVICRLAQWRMA